MSIPHDTPSRPILPTRRAFLNRTGLGLGSLAFAQLLGEVGGASAAYARRSGDSSMGPRIPHFAPKAKRVIHLFMNGGPSQFDTFDPKPALEKWHGKELPAEQLDNLSGRFQDRAGAVLASPFKFARYGQSGLDVSELFPHVAQHADKLCVIRSMISDVPNHAPGMLMMNTGETRLARPSIGSWVLYGLGTPNRELPGYVVLCPKGMPTGQSRAWQSAFLPGVYRGTHIETKRDPSDIIRHLRRDDIDRATQRGQIALTRELNNLHGETRRGDRRLEGRIQSMELAFRMQTAATDAFDLRQEPEHIREMYGDDDQGRMMLMARRLAERGVRYVQTYHANGQPWDSHRNIENRHRKLAGECDQAIAALLTDLERRGLLEETLVIWGGEMGRTPNIQLPLNNRTAGRDHHVNGFTLWMAGGGVKPGIQFGRTDEFGLTPVENPVHVHDLHATILHLLGLDHEQLTYRYSGREFSLTDVHGRVVHQIVS